MKGSKLGHELQRLRTAADLDVHQVARRTRGVVSAAALVLLETNLSVASPVALRALAKVYRVTPWSLLEAAGYVTAQDARDGIAAARAA